MAIPTDKAAPIEQEAADGFPDAMIDIEDIMSEPSEESVAVSGASSARYTGSAEVRRKIEERLELKLLKDELGFDDKDL